MAEKPQHRRHPLDRILQRGRHLDLGRAQHGADVDQIAQAPRAAPTGCATRWPPSGRICAGISRSSDAQRLASCASAEPPSATSPAIRPFSARSRAGPVELPGSGAGEVAQLRGEARQHRAAQRRVAPRGRRSRRNARSRRRSGSPTRRSARRSGARRSSRRASSAPARAPRRGRRRRRSIRSASQPKPCQAASQSGPGRGRKPDRRRVAHQLAGKLDVAGEIAAPRCASPGQRSPSLQPQIRRHPADQRMAIEPGCGETARSASRRSRVSSGGASRPRRRRTGSSLSSPAGIFIGLVRDRDRTPQGRGEAARPGSRMACPDERESMPFRNKETRELQAATADGAGCSNRPAGRLPERAASSLTSRAPKNPSTPSYSARWQGSVRRSPSAVIHSAAAPISAGSIGRRSTGAPRAQQRLDPLAALPPARASRCNRPACRPAAASRPRRAAGSPAPPRAARRPPARFRCGTSGWRRIAPVAVHGASSRTASTGCCGRQVSASAATASTGRPSRFKIGDQPVEPAGRAVDRGDLGAGIGELRGLAARRGAQSTTSRPATSPNSRAGSAAAASCTHQAPSA